MKTQHDVLIIGGGPIGILVARRLAENGLRVTVLEAGEVITYPPGSHYRNTPRFRRLPDSYFAEIDQFLKPVNDDPNTNLPGVADSSIFGGQGILWTNNCPRAMKFERWDALPSDTWEKNYAEAERVFGVIVDPAQQSKTGLNVTDCLQASLVQEQRCIKGLPFAGRVFNDGQLYFNAPSDILDGATSQVRKRVQIYDRVRVSRIHATRRRVTHVEIQDSKNYSGSSEAPAIIVAGGAVATPQLLYQSGIRPRELGRGFSFHALLFGQVVLKSELCLPGSASDIAPRLWIPPTPDSPWHIQVLRDTSPLPSTEQVENPHRLLEFQAFLPVEFREENEIRIAEDGGFRFRFSFSDNDRVRMQAMEADVHRLAKNLGLWRRGCEPTWVPHGSAHLVGTSAMDVGRRVGVTDTYGRVHGFDNFYLTTVGLIPVPVAVNPTLTAAALALNTCDTVVS